MEGMACAEAPKLAVYAAAFAAHYFSDVFAGASGRTILWE
jgi:hypothetical protein